MIKSEMNTTARDLSKLSQIFEQWSLLPNNSQGKDRKTDAKDFALNFQNNLLNSAEQHLLISSDNSWLIGLKKLAWDSDFFQFGIGKLEPLICCENIVSQTNIESGLAIIQECLELARSLNIDHLSCQVHPSDTVSQLVLQRSGFFTADTIVCYELGLSTHVPKANDSRIRLATEPDLSELKNISGLCFSDRRYNTNRFNSDAQFTTTSVRKLYEKWIENSIIGGLADATLVAIVDNNIAGFITIKLPSDKGVSRATIPLNAVHPSFQNQGIYRTLVDASLSWLSDRNVNSVEIRTQLPNLGVHRTWQNLGAKMSLTYHTHQIDLRQL